MSQNAQRFHKPWRPYLKFNAEQRREIEEFFEEFPELNPTPFMEASILKGIREYRRKHPKREAG